MAEAHPPRKSDPDRDRFPAFRPKNIPFDIPGVCDTDTILYRGRVPKDIVIVGGGPVGVEFATICHALGAKVTLVDRGRA